MARVCKKCGAKLDDDNNYCVICDKYVDAVDETEFGIDKDDKSAFAIYNKPAELIKEQKKTSSTAKMVIFLVVGLAVVLGAIYFITTFEKNTYKGVVDDYYTSLEKGYADDYKELFISEYYANKRTELDGNYSSIQAEIASGYEFKYKIKSAKHLISDDKENIASALGNVIGSLITLETVYEVDVEITISKDGSTTTRKETIWAIEEGGKWYIYTAD